MLDVELPEDASVPPPVRSFRACLSSLLEVPVDVVPNPDVALDAAVSQWRTWLAELGFGLVPVADASTFTWPGYWVAVLDAPDDTHGQQVVLMFGTPPGVVLSPQEPGLLGRAARRLPVTRGYVVAALDPAASTDHTAPREHGHVEALVIADRAEAPMRRVAQVRAIEGVGLEGDRYARRAGTFTPRRGKSGGHDLTLIEAEVLDALTLPDGGGLGYAQARRNLVTRGVDLNALVGRRFTVGDVECLGRRLCEPCAHLEQLTHRGVLRGLIHKGGLRADILTGGTIQEGADVRVADEFSGVL